MTVIFPYCVKEMGRIKELLEWIAELSPNLRNHSAILLAAAPVPRNHAVELSKTIRGVFGSCVAIRQSVEDERPWPMSANAMFKVGANYMAQSTQHNGAWFWCEPDCIPIKPDWLDAIQAEYVKGGKPFMGCKYEHPYPHINGCMVYPKINTRNPTMLTADNVPWDCCRPQITLRHAHPTRLIQRSLANPKTNTPHTFQRDSDLSVIWPEAKVFHGCKDDSLIDMLRWRNRVVTESQISHAITLKNRIKGLLHNGSSYYHSGNYGDIVYALYSIKLCGGGSLVIGPEQYKTCTCSHPIRKSQYDVFESFVLEQPYITGVSFSEKYPNGSVQIDLNTFRNNWNNAALRKKTGINSLARMHAHTLGVEHFFNENEVWLTVKKPIYHGMICVHRSHRYRVRDFPWKAVLDRYGKDMLFIGLERECVDFCNEFGVKLSYWKVKDLLELARLVAGAKAFVGNQSFPCSVALGLGITTLQETWYSESPDCMFNRTNFFNQRSNLGEFDKHILQLK